MNEEKRGKRMHDHLLSQFYNKPNLKTLLEVIGEEFDELIRAFTDLENERWIDTGIGQQLDGCGEIVDYPRKLEAVLKMPFFGFDGQKDTRPFGKAPFRRNYEDWRNTNILPDPAYRILLWRKVFTNSTHALAEDTISSTLFIFHCTKMRIREIGNAKINIGVGKLLTDADLALAQAIDLFILMAGIGIEELVYFDSDNFFGFLSQPDAKGFNQGIMARGFEAKF